MSYGKNLIYYKTEYEIGLMKEAALLVSKTLTEVAKVLKAGMTTLQIDALHGFHRSPRKTPHC